MKRFFLMLVASVFISSYAFSQKIPAHQHIAISKYINEMWGEWRKEYLYKVYGDYDNFVIYDYSIYHPSQFIMRIKINDYSNDRKSKKRHRQPNGWYQYSGVVEYFMTDYNANYQKFNIGTWPRCQLDSKGYCIENAVYLDEKSIKVISRPATIKFYGNNPSLYNIFFDNIGIAISIMY